MSPPRQPSKVSIPRSLEQISSHWSPKRVASLNDSYDVRIVKVAGEFVWHSHADTDELFYILSGDLTIQLREPGNEHGQDLEDIVLTAGEMVVIPKGLRHRPVTTEGKECAIMILEPSTVVNTGDATDTNGLKNAVEDLSTQ